MTTTGWRVPEECGFPSRLTLSNCPKDMLRRCAARFSDLPEAQESTLPLVHIDLRSFSMW